VSRDLSATLRSALAATETGEVAIALLTLSSPELATPIRLATNTEDVASNGETFSASPIRVVLPSETEDGPPRGSLTIENVSRVVIQSLRAATQKITAKMDIVLASDPDTIEATWEDFTISGARWDTLEITADVTQEPFLKRRFPTQRFTPGDFPGLFP
jgi:hypothetical protein